MRSRRSYQSEKLLGSRDPSVKVCPKYTKTDGVDAQRLLRAGGLILDPWQADALDDWMALTPQGRWLCRTVGFSIPRQNGKTGLIEGRAEAGMIMYKEQVIYTAHLQKTATETFEEMANFFETAALSKYLKTIKTALGREQIILNNGARIKFLARTRNGGRGQHGDLLIFDEAQELDEDAQASFIPAISASLNPQVIYGGTPPDDNAFGAVFRGIRTNALEGKSKTISWIEYSVDEIGDVRDKARWARTNPALGTRILLSTIDGECEQMSPITFARERLGYWAPITEKKAEYVIKPALWDACVSDELKPEGKTAYGVKFTLDGSEVVLCGAVIPDSGPARVSMIERRPTGYGTQWLADWLNERYSKAAAVVIDGKNGADVLIDKISDTWRFKGSVIRPTAKDVMAAAGTICDSLNEKTLTWYRGQDALRESAISSIKRPINGGWGFGGDNSAPIEAAALALWGAKTAKRNPNKLMRIG